MSLNVTGYVRNVFLIPNAKGFYRCTDKTKRENGISLSFINEL